MKRFFLVAILCLSATLGILQAQSPVAAEIPELARQLNLWRLQAGLEPLVYNATLERMAASQADFIIRQPQFPADPHAGAQGENVRQRSQFDQFKWPTYSHPELMSVTEIAAVGTVETAIDFWQGSDIHNRSVTNATYREIGIAARQYGSDILFIVVLGGQPDVLPVLVDVEDDLMYLTNERAEWTGDWIGEAVETRFLDVERQPITDWTEWERTIEIDDELSAEAIYIEYRDAADTRTAHEIVYDPIWTSVPVPEDVVITTVIPTPTALPANIVPSDTPTSAPVAFPTNTPPPTTTPTPFPTTTPFPTVTPTFTPQPGSAILFFNENVFALYNAGADYLDLSNISFQREDIGFVGRFWEEVSDILNISALPSTDCVTIVPEDNLTYAAPPECRQVLSIVQEPDPRYFWLDDFEVLQEGEVIATCEGEADADRCDILIP
jgi:hypothetical protein